MSLVDSMVADQAAPRRKGTLLIVDDEEGPRQSLRVIFKEQYHILMASDGPTAIQLAQNNSIDVAVLDIRMSGMSGIEVLERLKYVDSSIQVIMMTAFETTETMREALRLRACDYLNKPFDVNTVRAAVASAMQRRTLEGEIHDNAEKLRELTNELQEQKMQAQKSETRGEIYASIIHDINGPLTVISGFTQMMNQRIGSAERLEREDVEFIRERLKTITRQVGNCIEIARRYLGIIRRQPHESQRTGINELLDDLAHLVRVHPSRKNHQFAVHPLPQNMAVMMHGTDILQALLNLIVNGFQCSATEHSVEVTAQVFEALALDRFKDSSQERFLNIESFENKPPIIALSVRDTGPGIPPEVVPKIFQPFFTTKGAQEGTGLGLNIVLRLVKEARAALHVRTEPGKGTSFTLYLPGVPMTAAAPATVPAS